MANVVDYEPIRKAAIAMLRNGEATLSEIAEAAGVARQYVRYWAHHGGVPDWQKLRREKIEAAFRRRGGEPLRKRRRRQ